MVADYQSEVRFRKSVVYPTIEALKLAKGCVDCGYNRHHAALHFDHVNPETKTSVPGWMNDRSKIKTRAKLDRFLTHVDKCCVVRCANCHAERTAREGHWSTAE